MLGCRRVVVLPYGTCFRRIFSKSWKTKVFLHLATVIKFSILGQNRYPPCRNRNSRSQCLALAHTYSSYSVLCWRKRDEMNGYRMFVPVNVGTDKKSPSFSLPTPSPYFLSSSQKNGTNEFPVFFVFHLFFVASNYVPS